MLNDDSGVIDVRSLEYELGKPDDGASLVSVGSAVAVTDGT